MCCINSLPYSEMQLKSFDTMPQVQSDVQQLLLLLFTSFSTLFQLQAPACSVTSVTPMTPTTALTHSTMKMMKLSSLRPWNSWLNVNLMLPSAEKSSKLVRWNLAFYVLYFCHDITFTQIRRMKRQVRRNRSETFWYFWSIKTLNSYFSNIILESYRYSIQN